MARSDRILPTSLSSLVPSRRCFAESSKHPDRFRITSFGRTDLQSVRLEPDGLQIRPTERRATQSDRLLDGVPPAHVTDGSAAPPAPFARLGSLSIPRRSVAGTSPPAAR